AEAVFVQPGLTADAETCLLGQLTGQQQQGLGADAMGGNQAVIKQIEVTAIGQLAFDEVPEMAELAAVEQHKMGVAQALAEAGVGAVMQLQARGFSTEPATSATTVD